MPFSTSSKEDATTNWSEVAKPKPSMAFDAFSSFSKPSTDAFSSLPKRSTDASSSLSWRSNASPENTTLYDQGAWGIPENERYSMMPIHPKLNTTLTVPTTLTVTYKPRGRDDFYSGQIILAIYTNTPWHSQARRDNRTNLSRTKYGWVHSKWRPMVILTTHAQHMVVIPLRSFSGRGVDYFNDTPDTKKEFISVKSEAQINNIDLEGQDYLKLIGPLGKNTASCLCMTEVHSIDYRTPFSDPKPANKLTAHSTRALLRAYKKFLYQSIDDSLVQAAEQE